MSGVWPNLVLLQPVSWPEVALAAINVAQVVLLSWIGGEQAAARRERHRRQEEELAKAKKPS